MKYLKKLDIKLVKGEYKNPAKGQVKNPGQIYDVFQSLKDTAQETLISVYLNNELEVLAYNILSTGSKSETTIDFDDIYGYSFVLRAKYFILLHNHPDGNPTPSKDDSKIMKRLINSSKELEKTFLDFIIVGDMDMNETKKNYWSMFEEMDGGSYELGSIF